MTPDQPITSEDGFGLVELLVAMVILQVALLALVGAFGAGSVALGRASRANTAQALANQQMELYRSMTYDPIGLDHGRRSDDRDVRRRHISVRRLADAGLR